MADEPVAPGPRVHVDRLAARVSPRDRLLVEWVAQAKVGDPLPAPYCYASRPLESVIRNLAILGVIARPGPDQTWASMAGEATAAARIWLQAHPPADGPA